MATIRLVPSILYNAAGTSYLTVSDASNAYTNTDSTTYATVNNIYASTTNRYVYLRGFNFSDVPSNAVINSFSIKLKASESGGSTSSSYRPVLCKGTSTYSNAYCNAITTSVSVKTFTFTQDYATFADDGDDFGIRINCRRSSRNTAASFNIYGAEIEVNYTVPVQYTVTIQNSTSANVEASDRNPYEGDDVIISTNTLSGLTIKDNGTDVTSQFIQATGNTVSAVPGSHFTKGFSSSSGNFYQNSSTTSTAWLEYAIGHSAESPYSTSNTSNTYVKPEGSTGWINYEFDFSEIPASATINSVSVKVYGAREDSTIDSTHVARFQCYSGSTAKGTIQNFTSTSNGSVTVSDVGTWTATELHDAILRFELGYYGGRMLGITWTVTYTVSGYIYTITAISTNHTIVVSSGGVVQVLYYKNNGNWISATRAYKKINGSWVEQSDLTNVFDSQTNYVKGN